MIKIIRERISATESFAFKLKDLVNMAALKIETSNASQIEKSTLTIEATPVTTNSDCMVDGRIFKCASLIALTIGGVGWIASPALWSKILAIGGMAGCIYLSVGNIHTKRHSQMYLQPQHSAETTMSASFIADQASILISKLKEVSKLWADFTESSKSMLIPKINDSSIDISSHERFKLQSIIRVPKTLSFPLIEYRNILEDATTSDKLKEAAKKVAKNAIAEIDRVATSQIGAYKEMNEMISK